MCGPWPTAYEWMESLVIKRLGCYVWHRGDTNSESVPSDFTRFKISMLMVDWFPLCCQWQGHQPPTHILFRRVKRPRCGKPAAVNYKAICIVIHAALREETHARAFSFHFFPSRATLHAIPVAKKVQLLCWEKTDLALWSHAPVCCAVGMKWDQ